MREPLAVLAVVAVIVVGKSLAAFAIVLAFGYPVRTALTVSASLAQIGEFSFILAGLGIALGLLPAEGRDLILAGALLSITLNPLTFAGIAPMLRWLERRPRLLALLESRFRRANRAASTAAGSTGSAAPPSPAAMRDHAIVVGYGRVGGAIGPALRQLGLPFVVIERDRRRLEPLLGRGVPIIDGDAGLPATLESAGIAAARLLVIAIPDGFEARRVLELARAANPSLDVVARAHSETELERLEALGVSLAVMGERELAMSMLEYALRSLGVPRDRARLAAERDLATRVDPEGT